MMRLYRAVPILVLCLPLWGCGGLGNQPSFFATGHWDNGQAEDANRMLAYAQRLLMLSQDALQRERTAAMRALARRKSALNRLRMALLLALADPPLRDDARAAVLLQGILKDKMAATALKNLAAVLARVVDERLQQEERYRKLAAKATEGERRADLLQHKLDALKAIEKTMINREPVQSPVVK
jgi:hypothetical protein